jgi:outer membrane protein assembly factor BamB
MNQTRLLRRGSARTIYLIAGILAVFLAGGFLLYKSGWLQRQLAHDSDNIEEMAHLRDANPQVPPPAEAGIGWPQWRGPLRDGRAPEGPLRTDWDKKAPQELWRFECHGGYSSFAVVGSKVYTQDRQGDRERVLCLDVANGKLLWEHAYPVDYARMGYSHGPRATPTVERNRVYTVGATGKFLCLQPPDSPGAAPAVLWEHDLRAEFHAELPQWGIACSPLIDGDQVIVIPGGRDGAIAAYDKISGELRWKFGSNPAGYSSPIAATVHGVHAILAFVGDALLCLSTSGQLMGSFSWNTNHYGNIATPIVVDEFVFISSGYNMGCALLRLKPDGDKLKLEPVYTRRGKVMQNHHSSCVYRDGYLYGFNDNRLSCVNFREGKELEDWEALKLAKGTLILADKYLIILTETGDLALVEATPVEFHQVARLPSGLSKRENWALPVLVDGRLYLRDESKILCLDVRP